jgi:hypothetical protein
MCNAIVLVVFFLPLIGIKISQISRLNFDFAKKFAVFMRHFRFKMSRYLYFVSVCLSPGLKANPESSLSAQSLVQLVATDISSLE